MEGRLSYKEAIEYLKENPREIYDAWNTPSLHIAGSLFDYLCPKRCESFGVGCPAMVKSGMYHSSGGRVDKFIRSLRLPKTGLGGPQGKHFTPKILLKHLNAFCKAQEHADRVYKSRLKPTVWPKT